MKAIVLLSGGLDSVLALKIMMDHGIEAIALHFTSAFFCCDERDGAAPKIASALGAEFILKDLGEDYLEIVKNPKHGHGKNVNPCIDCKIAQLKYAKKLMVEKGASFVVTGEVLGQRPMSQHKKALMLIEKESGLEGLILRPLSAKVLEPTIAENEGWVDRQKLLDIQGRARKYQIELAGELGISGYSNPGGGCILTEMAFASRVKDIFKHKDPWTINTAETLKLGRHFRLSKGSKLIVGRNEAENDKLMSLAQSDDIVFNPPEEVPGPTAIGRGTFDDNMTLLAARIVARYIKPGDGDVEVFVDDKRSSEKYSLSVESLEERLVKKFMIV